MPKHEVYLELFCGSAAVLLNKQRCHIETVNDLDDDIINFFTVLRDNPGELSRRISLTPYARAEYANALISSTDPIEQARSYCVRCWQGFGNSQLYNNGFKSGQQTNSPNPAKTWTDLPAIMAEAAERLKGVQIEHLPALEILKRYNTPDVFIYADPPYMPEIRKNHLYQHEMTRGDHIQLLEALLAHPGLIMISGYDNDLYAKLLTGWRTAQKKTRAEGGISRTEVLWMNYKSEQLDIYDCFPEVLP